MATVDVRSLSLEELKAQLVSKGYPAFRAKQIREWLDRGVTDFEQMSNLPKELRLSLAEWYSVPGVTILRKLVSAIDGTVKYLFRLDDGETVESVLMQYKHGWSQCLSTQVGCKMGCAFCASTLGGYKRSLMPGEILSQLYTAQKDLGERISHIVLMGMGEPLDNYDNVMKFLELIKLQLENLRLTLEKLENLNHIKEKVLDLKVNMFVVKKVKKHLNNK